MSFHKRSFQSFLDQTKPRTMPSFEDREHERQPCESGLGHEIIGGSVSKDPGGFGFADEANGLMLCTEYLGFESYDMIRMSDNEVEKKMTCRAEEVETERNETKRRKTKENVVVAREPKIKYFPPPLSTLNGRGKRSFYLRQVRKDGRLELTQVMIDRPEIFHASREDGRLRLHFVDGVCNPMRAICDDPAAIVDLKDEPINGLDNKYKAGSISRSDLEPSREINEDNGVASDDQVVDLSMINDDTGVKSWRCKSSHEVSVKRDNDVVAHFSTEEHDAREWRYKSCYKIGASRNPDENDNHHHHQHHIHPYHHHKSNSNMHLWSRSYVKTR